MSHLMQAPSLATQSLSPLPSLRAHTQLLPTNEASLEPPVLTPLSFPFALLVTLERGGNQATHQPGEMASLVEVMLFWFGPF